MLCVTVMVELHIYDKVLLFAWQNRLVSLSSHPLHDASYRQAFCSNAVVAGAPLFLMKRHNVSLNLKQYILVFKLIKSLSYTQVILTFLSIRTFDKAESTKRF